jgi:hypothetical protein
MGWMKAQAMPEAISIASAIRKSISPHDGPGEVAWVSRFLFDAVTP